MTEDPGAISVEVVNGEDYYEKAMQAILLLVSHRLITDAAGNAAVKRLMKTTFHKVIEERRRHERGAA